MKKNTRKVGFPICILRCRQEWLKIQGSKILLSASYIPLYYCWELGWYLQRVVKFLTSNFAHFRCLDSWDLEGCSVATQSARKQSNVPTSVRLELIKMQSIYRKIFFRVKLTSVILWHKISDNIHFSFQKLGFC